MSAMNAPLQSLLYALPFVSLLQPAGCCFFQGRGLTIVATVLEGGYLDKVNDVLQSQQVLLDDHASFYAILARDIGYALFADRIAGLSQVANYS